MKKDDLNLLISKRVSETIKQSGLTQKELAEKIFVTQSCIAHYLKGDALPSLDTLSRLCTVLDVDPAYLLGIEN